MTENFVNPLLDFKYDLIHDVIKGEPTSSLTEFALSRIVVSLWQKNIVDTVKQTLNVDLEHIFQDIERCKNWFQKIENQILNGSQNGVSIYFTFAEKYLPKTFNKKFEELICKIKKNMRNFFNALGNLNVSLTKEIIVIIVRNIQLTLQGTINLQKTASHIVESSNLSAIDKYAISCYYCLEEKICDLLKEMPDDFMSCFHNNQNIELISYLTYENLPSNPETNKLNDSFSRSENADSVTFNCISEENEVGAQHFWENYVAIDSTNFSLLTFTNSNSVNLWCYSLSRLNYLRDIESFCEYNGYRLLTMLGSDSRWSSYFLASSLYVLIFLKKMYKETAIKTILVCSLYNISYQDYYYKLLLEYGFFEKFVFSSKTILHMVLVLYSSIPSLLSLRSNNDVKKLFDNDKHLLKLIYELLESEKLYLLKDLIEELYTESIAKIFVHRLVKKISVKFCVTYLGYIGFDRIADRLFIYCETKGFNDYKKELPFIEDGKIIGDLIKRDQSLELEHVNDFLNWCFDWNDERVVNCKKDLFNLEEHPNRYCNIQLVNHLKILLKNKSFRKLKKHLKWTGISKEYLKMFLYSTKQ